MTGAVSPLKALADAIRETARTAAAGVVQVRARGVRPATAAHVGPDLVVAPLHALDRDDGLVVARGADAFDATIAGRDDTLDLVLLRAPGLGASPLTLADDVADAAQLVVAVALSWQGDVMSRLASVTGRACPPRRWRTESLPSLLRTDIVAGRGVSGGVLVNAEGHLVAWLTTGLSRGGVLGIPGPLLANRVERLATHGRIRRGYVGMGIQPVNLPPSQQTHGKHGLLVSGLDAEGPAALGGIYVGDVLITADNQPLSDPAALQVLLTEARIGTPLPLQVVRGASLHDIAITVGERRR